MTDGVYIPDRMTAAEYRAIEKPGKNKYGNKKVSLRGVTFDSAGERDRWLYLCHENETGEISNLKRQVTYTFIHNGIRITAYRADFVYERGGATVVEDFKGIETPEFKIKEKMMKAFFGIEILVTKRVSWRNTNASSGTAWKARRKRKAQT